MYLDGDGSPWSHRRWLNEDPTSRNPLILELMHLDPNPSLLLGRPCYHGLSKIPPCTYKYWTSQRYSEEVVASMTRALQIWLKKHTFNEIVLIGFSGGGTLAVLMAPRFDNVRTVVTVAANLDVEAWSRYHGYSPLTDSLNPAELPPLKNIKQIHIAGLDDEVVPAEIIKAYANKQTDAAYWPFEGYSHKCCWAKAWKAILTKF
ncbi:MAG: alpha/beta fold hydrolase [Gammaproteobacteria bacterium]